MQAQAPMPDLTAGLHPTMAAALAPHLHGSIEARRARYVSDLLRHDWQHEYSDDGDAYRAGHAEHQRLLAVAAEIDPHFVLWNRHAPRDFFRVPA